MCRYPYPTHAHLNGSGALGPIVEVPSAPHTERGRGEGSEGGKIEGRENGGKAMLGSKSSVGLLRNNKAADVPAASSSSSSSSPYSMSYTACRRFAFDYSISPQLINDHNLLQAMLLCQGQVTVTEGEGEREEEGEGDIDNEMSSVIGECHPSPPENVSPFISPYLSYPPLFPLPPHPSAHRPYAPHTAGDVSGHNSAHTVKGMRGLNFCEFLELVATIALEGLCEQERDLFQTPFSKVREYETVCGRG